MQLKQSTEITQEYVMESLKWLSYMAANDRWDLSDEEVAILLGEVGVDYYRNLKRKALNHQKLVVTWDIIERINLLLNISKSLFILAPTERHALDWFNKENSGAFLKNQSAKNYLLSHRSVIDFQALNNYLQSLIK